MVSGQNPSIEIIIVEDSPSEALPNVLDGSLDIAFVFGNAHTPECHSLEFWSEPMVIALPAKHQLGYEASVTWADLACETFLIRHFGTASQLYAHLAWRIGERDKPRLSARCRSATP